ncbi:hypothetical protein [Nocardioides sp.]|uniref:hypothetical protein n=1 Tax=Nocardioides sp. TaxID=35761 RepID=UPI0031FEBA13|nr:hypothetical protein [Nocardioides sp.]
MERLSWWLHTARGRVVGALAVLALAVGAGFAGSAAELEPASPDVPGIIGLELVGTPDGAQQWMGAYGGAAVSDALLSDLAFILCWCPLLALLALWTGQNYRTLTTRRLGVPLALAVLGAGALDLLEDLFLQLGANGVAGLDPWPRGWQLAAVASWGKWLIVVVAAVYVVGGILSLGLSRKVLAVLRRAEGGSSVQAARTMEDSHFGLAFSGGGIRAASISLGALQALERDGSMGWGAADHVTSVSGGSYMTGAWSLARTVPGPATPGVPAPWAWLGSQPGPEERHLRANLGYLLSNTPRGTGQDPMSQTPEAGGIARAQRLPAVVATVLTGMLANALVFLGILWILAQLMGWFYRWYFGLTCVSWLGDRPLSFTEDHGCLTAPERVGWPILGWFCVGLVFVLLWVVLAKFTDVAGATTPPAWLLGPKLLGYGGLAVGAALLIVLGGIPLLIDALWRPVAAHDLLTTVVAVVGAIGSASAVLRILRKPLAKLAPTLGGALFALVLLFLLCRWALAAMTTAPQDRHTTALVVVAVALVVVHLCGAAEFWSLAAFYRGKLRSSFATYRVEDSGGVRARPYVNNDVAAAGERVEPGLDTLPERSATTPTGTPLTICASATVSGRGVRTHYGVPALSVTFSPGSVRLFAPLEEDGLWQRYECPTVAMETLRPKMSSRITTMMAVGLSGAAVSPAMGRFRIGPVSMLLAFANVRLGVWIPNPRYAAELAALGKALPRPGLGYLFKEFFGFHDPSDLFLYITDGGHWENTALVELLRTSHHQEIVCVDADSGPGHLATSISKAIDLAQLECAASIAIHLDALRSDPDPSPGRDYSPRSVNLGLVRRTDGNEERLSVLWYCKPALTEDMPPQLLAYREVDPTFPRVSTVNQFFHVAQFAAYRDLGRYNAKKILAARTTLARTVTRHPTFAAFRSALPAHEPRTGLGGVVDLVESLTGPGAPEEPEAWVLTELAELVAELAGDRTPDERVAYEQELYESVRTTLA